MFLVHKTLHLALLLNKKFFEKATFSQLISTFCKKITGMFALLGLKFPAESMGFLINQAFTIRVCFMVALQ